MSDTQHNSVWSIWIDENKKVITTKESPAAKQVFFKTREIGMNEITKLVSKGYKIG